MYQFTTTNVINSSLDSNGSTAKFAGSTTAFAVTRVGTFLKDNIVSIYKRAYYAGVKEIAQVTIPTVTIGLAIRLEVDIKLTQNTQADYANILIDFKKPLYVEVIATGTAETDATALKNALNATYGDYIVATNNSADVIVTAKNNYQRFNSIKVFSEAGFTNNSLVEPLYDDVTNSTFAINTPGKVGFGDDAWMVSHVSMQTVPNTKAFGIGMEERPILGGNYTQYTLRYSITKDGTDGIVAGGTSVTTHIFYVLSSLVAAFEAAIIATTVGIDTIGSIVTDLAVVSATCDLSNYGTSGLTYAYTSTPSGVTGGVWARDLTLDDNASGGGSPDFTKVTISPAGVLTLASGHGLAATDTFGIKCTCDGFTKSFTITVQD